eukprot:3122089-Amphidinium_carterae.1
MTRVGRTLMQQLGEMTRQLRGLQRDACQNRTEHIRFFKHDLNRVAVSRCVTVSVSQLHLGGMLLLTVFGLPPLCHYIDDPTRAVLYAQRLCETARDEGVEGAA